MQGRRRTFAIWAVLEPVDDSKRYLGLGVAMEPQFLRQDHRQAFPSKKKGGNKAKVAIKFGG